MPKKKKTQLKPVARGFATTSTPKKSHTTPESEGETSTTKDDEPKNDDKNVEDITSVISGEEQSLQALVDQHQQYVDKEVNRSLKAIENERRFSNTFHLLELSDRTVVNQIVEHANDHLYTARKMPREPKERAIVTLAITWGILNALGFPSSVIEECLNSVRGVAIEEALEWLYLHGHSSVDPETPISPNYNTASTLSDAYSEADTSIAAGPCSNRRTTESPNEEYAKVKDQIKKLVQGESRNNGFDARLRELRSRLAVLQKDYFFDQLEAEELYQNLPQLPASADARLPSEDTVPKTSAPVDIFENDDEDEDGGMFQLLDEQQTVEERGRTIQLKDMSLPKLSTGRSPKTLLREIMTREMGTIHYTSTSGSSRAKRASVNIRHQGQTRTFTMDSDIGCYTDEGAENYVSLVALHSLSTSGPKLFSGSFKSVPSLIALLPGSYTELWDVLEARRKSDVNTFFKQTWRKLTSILGEKYDLVPAGKDHPRPVKVENTVAQLKLVSSYESLSFAREKMSRLKDTEGFKMLLIQRNALPIASSRGKLLEALASTNVLIICGATGSGKSTQLPTYILENELMEGRDCNVAITEPRRISAVSLAKRCSLEIGEDPNSIGQPGSLIGYNIRLENRTHASTRLTFMTNGIALRMLGSGDNGFKQITHLIVDEVHERSIESDTLLLIVKTLLKRQPKLKVILMSATADSDRMSAFFEHCPVIHIPGRTFPVEVNMIEDAIELTGWKPNEESTNMRHESNEDDFEENNEPTKSQLPRQFSPETIKTVDLLNERYIAYDLIRELLVKLAVQQASQKSFLIFMPGFVEIRKMVDVIIEHPILGQEDVVKVYPLHSSLSSEEQSSVFEVLPDGMIKIVVATNIAETGITISDIDCVIDTGKHREMRYTRQINRLVETFIAKSNAIQRRGRAGRVKSGVCFHLFTYTRFEKMADHPVPEMLRLNLTDLILRLKTLKVDLGSGSINDVLAQAFDPPPAINVTRALSLLVEVGALTTTETITPLGLLLSKVPVDIHLSKFLLMASILRCLDPALTIAATLSSKSPFMSPLGREREARTAKASFQTSGSDFLTIHNMFSSWRKACENKHNNKFCRANFLNEQTLVQIEELRQQYLTYLIDASFISVEEALLRDMNRNRYSRRRHNFISLPTELNSLSDDRNVVASALAAGLYPRILGIRGGQALTILSNQVTSLHPTSVNYGKKLSDFECRHLSYFTLQQGRKLYAWETSPAPDLALILLCGDAEFKPASNSVTVGKIRLRSDPRTIAALSVLRRKIDTVHSQRYKGISLTKEQSEWEEFLLLILKVNLERNNQQPIGIK